MVIFWGSKIIFNDMMILIYYKDWFGIIFRVIFLCILIWFCFSSNISFFRVGYGVEWNKND